MIRFILYDDEFNVLSKMNFKDMGDYYVPSEKIKEVSEHIDQELLDEIDYGITILLPYENDFIIQNLSNIILNFAGLESEKEVRGCLFGKTFPIFKNSGLIDIFNEIYKTGNRQKFIVAAYSNRRLVGFYEYTIFKSKENIYFLAKNNTDLELEKIKQQKIFDNSLLSIIHFDENGNILNANKKFLKFSGFQIKELRKMGIGDLIIESNNYNPSIHNYGEVLNKISHDEISFSDSRIKIKTKSGNKKWIKTHTTIHDNGIIQTNCNDISEEMRYEYESLRLKETLSSIEDFSKITIMTIKNNNYYWTDEIYNLLEIEHDTDTNFNLFRKYTHPDDLLKMDKIIKNLTPENPKYKVHCRLITEKGNLKYIEGFTKINSFKDGEPEEWEGVYYDITELTEKNKQLKETLAEKEQLLIDKEFLLKEVHHRVKNNLQIILSLIRLDKRFNSDNPERILDETQNRINAIALIHEKIYGAGSLADINLNDYILSLVNSILNISDSNISFSHKIEDIGVNIDKAIPLGLIINELINNTLKHAFPNNESGNVNIVLKYNEDDEDKLILIVEDDGIGFEDIDIYNSSSLGLTVVNNLVYQIGGNINKLDKLGTSFKIEFLK